MREGVLHRMEGLPARFHEASSLGNPEREGAADLGVRRRPPRRPFGASDPNAGPAFVRVGTFV